MHEQHGPLDDDDWTSGKLAE